MSVQPPALPARILAWALGPADDARAVLGDLSEDFAAQVARRGIRHARRWYWAEAVPLAASALVGRALGRPIARSYDTEGRMTGLREMFEGSALRHDAGYALRALRRDPGFALLATVIIGLGVGAATSVFSVMSPLMLRPLPFDEPERLVLVERNFASGGLSGVTSRTSNVRDFRAQARSFEGIAGYNAFFDQLSYNLGGEAEPARLVGVNVTDDFLDVLGVAPALGRDFTPEEGRWGGFVDREGGPRTIVLTHGSWVRNFGADPSVVGRAYPLNDEPVTVIGVLPESFDFFSVFTPTTPIDFLLPWPISDGTDSWGNTTTMIARLRPGASVEAAQADLEGVIAGLQEAEPNRWGLDARVSPLQERLARPYRSALLLLAAAAGLVMLIVCVNLSNMLLARSPRRRREMAVRRTMGATRARLVRQLLLESVGISFSGAVLGVGLATLVTRFVASRSGLEIPMLSAISVDPAALGFTGAVALLAGLAVGAVPALSVSEGGEASALGGSSRGAGGRRGGRRFRELLVVVEVAMACVLLVFGGLVLRSFQRVMDVDLGFEPEGAVAWQLRSSRDFETEVERFGYYDQLAEAVQAVPGVSAVGMVDALPLGTNRTWGGRIVGKDYPDDEYDGFFPHVADQRYLAAMGIRVVEGRGLTALDVADAPPVALVSETMARTLFPGGEALGARLSLGTTEFEVVGVVADVRHRALEIGADPEVYFSMPQVPGYNTVEMVVRTDLPPSAVAAAVAEAIHGLEPSMPTEDYRTLDAIVERSVSPRRFTLQILGGFGVAALLLAAIGIYGVLSYSVTERIPEIGIRMALGESAGDVRRSVVGRTMTLAGVGVAAGIAISVAGSRFVSSLLFGIEPTDPTTLVAMAGVLLSVALLSGFLPALRASRTDSATALRSSA